MATLTVNRLTARSAMWYVLEGALIAVFLVNTTGVASPPALNDPYQNWVPYTLTSQFDLFYTAGSSSYSLTNPEQAKLQQLQVVVGYNQSVTYTDLLIFVIPARKPASVPSGSADIASPYLGLIHESSSVTLLSGQTKTYKLDLTSQWL